MPIQVLQREPSWQEKIFSSLGAGLEKGFDTSEKMRNLAQESKSNQEQKENDAARKFQYDSVLQRQKYEMEKELQANQLAGKKQQSNKENVKPLKGALETINRMNEIRKTGNLGIGSTYSPFPETRKLAGEYQQLGKSLIKFASNIPITNRVEFEEYSHDLSDPNITDAKAEGILKAMKRIINNSVKLYEGEEGDEGDEENKNISIKKRPLTAFVGKSE